MTSAWCHQWGACAPALCISENKSCAAFLYKLYNMQLVHYNNYSAPGLLVTHCTVLLLTSKLNSNTLNCSYSIECIVQSGL